MTALFKKMNFKGEPLCWIIQPPAEFAAAMAEMAAFTDFSTDLEEKRPVGFALAFVKTLAEIDLFAPKMAEKLLDDGLFWLAYPKGASKKHRCEFNRDTGWAALGELGYEPVRQIAIDEDWSALRFRRAEKIQKMTRSFAMTEVGKAKTGR